AGLGFAVRTTAGVREIPFVDRSALVCVGGMAGMVLISKWDNRRGVVPVGFETDPSMFRTSRSFTTGALLVVAALTALYTRHWSDVWAIPKVTPLFICVCGLLITVGRGIIVKSKK